MSNGGIGEAGLTGSNVDFSRLDLSEVVLSEAPVSLSVNLLAVVLGPEGRQDQISVGHNLKAKYS